MPMLPFQNNYSHANAMSFVQAAYPYRFFWASVFLHVILTMIGVQWSANYIADVSLLSAQNQIQATTESALRRSSRKKVDDLKAMKDLIVRISEAQHEFAPDIADPDSTPDELVMQAKNLRDQIQSVERKARAKEMGRVLDISPEQAMEKFKLEANEQAKTDAAADKLLQELAIANVQDGVDQKAAQAELMALTLSRYEQQSREALERRQSQLSVQHNGVAVQGAESSNIARSGSSGPEAAAGVSESAAARVGAAAVSSSGDALSAVQGASVRTALKLSGDRPNTRSYDKASVQPEAIPYNAVRLGFGNALGLDAPTANRIVLDHWYLIGPFQAPGPASMNTVYPPELAVDLDGIYRGKGKRVLRWAYTSAMPYPIIPADAAAQAIYYGYTEVRSDRARDVWMAMGADDDAKAWVNERLIWTSGNQWKAWYSNAGLYGLPQELATANLNESRRLVHLKAGRNTILFKLYNDRYDVFFSLAIEGVNN